MIAVVGAGPAGLAAAWRAAVAGHEVVVLERSPTVGGMAASFEVAGMRVDHGSHRLHPSTPPPILAALRHLLGDDLQVRPRHGRIHLAGRWVAFPLRPGNLLRQAPPAFTLRAARDAATVPLRRTGRRLASLRDRRPVTLPVGGAAVRSAAGQWRRGGRAGIGERRGDDAVGRGRGRQSTVGGDTFADVVRDGLGPTVLDAFYGPYARKLWDAEPEELAGELARRRISTSSPLDVVRRLAGGARPQTQTFLYPRTGFGAISEALADAAVAAGADIRLACGVRGLTPIAFEDPTRATAAGPGPNITSADWSTAAPRVDRAAGPSASPGPHTAVRTGAVAGGWTVQLDDGSELDVAQVWSTAPVAALTHSVEPAPPPSVATAAAHLRHRAMVLLYLVLDRPQWTPYDAHYFPGPEVVASRLSEPRNYRDNPGDPPDRTVLCAEIPCWAGDATWQAPDETLADRLAGELLRLGLPSVEPIHVESRRLPRVYPVYRTGFADDLAALETWSASLPGLVTFGRQGLFTPDNTHHALAMGWAAAEALGPDGSFDTRAWTGARDGFRSFVVED